MRICGSAELFTAKRKQTEINGTQICSPRARVYFTPGVVTRPLKNSTQSLPLTRHHPTSAEPHEIHSGTGRTSTIIGGLPPVPRPTPEQSHRLGISPEYPVSLFNHFSLPIQSCLPLDPALHPSRPSRLLIRPRFHKCNGGPYPLDD